MSFRALAGHELASAKNTWAGAVARRRLLAANNTVIPEDDLGGAAQAAIDDVFDAAAAAWSAFRIAKEPAKRFPASVDQSDTSGRLVAIWY